MKPVSTTPTSTSAIIETFLMVNTLETGGTERQFVAIANALDRNAFSVNLGCLKRTGPFLEEVSGLHEFCPQGSLFRLPSWRSRLNLSRFLQQKHVAVAHAFDFYSNLMLIPAARFARVPVVIGSFRQLGDLLTKRQFQVQNAAFRLCDRVVCNSKAAAERLISAGLSERKIVVIGNGLSEELFAPHPPALLKDPAVVVIGMVSRMNHPDKKHDLLLRVAARLAPEFPNARFVLAGDGPLKNNLEQQVREFRLTDQVTFLGDRRDVPAVLAAMDIAVLPSSSESLSNVILESMAAGLPVVAANVGGNPELVQSGKTGFLFPEGNEEQFAAALRGLITQPEMRQKFGIEAKELAREYSMPRIRDAYQDLYVSLLAKKMAFDHVGDWSTIKVEKQGTLQ
jgi:L-malate glycosyltransferase